MARPRKITKETVQKLEEGFLMGLSDREACIYADIAVSTLYNYCKKHKEFSERKELLKDNIKMKSKLNVAHGIKRVILICRYGILNANAKMNFHQSKRYSTVAQWT